MKKTDHSGNILSCDVLLLLVACFFYMASPMLVTPLITGFSESLGAGAFTMGIVGGLTNLCSLCCQPFAGGIADKVSKYRLGCIGVSFLILSCLGYVIALNPAMILLFRAINGIGFAFCSVCFSTWIANTLPPDRVGFGMGLYGMMNALAMAISPAIGVAVYQHIGYRAALGFAAGFAAVCIVTIQFCQNRGMPLGEKRAKKKLKLIEPRVIPMALVILCFATPYCATQSFLVRYAEARNLPITVGLFFTIYAVALLFSRFALSNLFDKVSFHKFLLASSISALLSLFFLTIMDSNLEMALGAVFMAGGYGIMCTVAQSASILRVEPENRGLANGTYYIGMNFGMAFGPIIGGILYGNLPLQMYFPILMLTVPICLLLYWATSSGLSGMRR